MKVLKFLNHHFNLLQKNLRMSQVPTTSAQSTQQLGSPHQTQPKTKGTSEGKLHLQKTGINFKSVREEGSLLTALKYYVHRSKAIKKEEEQSEDEDAGKIKAPKGTRDFHPEQMAVRRKVIDIISGVFRKHGAVEIDTPTFELKHILTGKYGEDSKLIYDLADQSKTKCSLRYDLTVPFARYMGTYTNIKKIKRFHIGKVYRRDQPVMTKGRFREFYQCDFDIAGDYDKMIPDAEVLVVMQEILQSVGVSNFKVKVNHRKLLEAIVQASGADVAQFKTICSSIDKLDKQPWSEVEAELVGQKGVSAKSAEIIGKLTQFKGEPDLVLEELTSKNPLEGRGKQALQDMGLLFKYLRALGHLNKVSFDLSLARGLDYYTGMIFEIVLVDKKYQVGSISGGGRYDNLIGMFSSNPIPSVGGSIGIERIFSIIEEQYKDKVKTNECEVLVATLGKIPVEQKLRILGRLWAAGVKAETLYVEKSNGDKQLTHAIKNEIPIVLWIGQSELKADSVKAKILYKSQQLMIPLAGLQKQITQLVAQYHQDYKKGTVKFSDEKQKK